MRSRERSIMDARLAPLLELLFGIAPDPCIGCDLICITFVHVIKRSTCRILNLYSKCFGAIYAESSVVQLSLSVWYPARPLTVRSLIDGCRYLATGSLQSPHLRSGLVSTQTTDRPFELYRTRTYVRMTCHIYAYMLCVCICSLQRYE